MLVLAEVKMMRWVGLVMLALVSGLVGCKAPVGASPVRVQVQPVEAWRSGGGEREGQRRRGGRGEQGVAPGSFDFYLLTLSWSPEFCATHGNDASAAAECAAPKGFVLHGLWPQNDDGSYPEDCAGSSGDAQPAPVDAQAYRDIFPDAHLLDHEWQTHGTCSGLAADVYFRAARRAKQAVVVPQELAQVTSQLQLTPQQILGDFARANPGVPADAFALSCGNNYLTAVEECLGKDLKAVSCGGVRSCRANVVRVTKGGE
jgi:ribonuclease T2